jgi:hypothetical protein
MVVAKDRRPTSISLPPSYNTSYNTRLRQIQAKNPKTAYAARRVGAFHERGQVLCHRVRVKFLLMQSLQNDHGFLHRRAVVGLDNRDLDGSVFFSAVTLMLISFVFYV